ncbi:MAG: hypothetical protein IPK53_10700 [bacterium]|nr:hypothetical protein [bacterium]
MDVQGTLVAIGTPDQLIRFTSADSSPQPGNWRGIVFNNSPDAVYDVEGNYMGGSALAHVEVEYGGTILMYLSRPYFAYNHIHDNIATGGPIPAYPWDTGVVTYYPNNNEGFVIRDSVIENNLGGGIKAESGLITITHNIIRNNISGSWAGGITCLNRECLILKNRIINNTGKDVTGAIFSYSSIMIVKSNLIANNIGPQTLSDRGGSVFSKWSGTFDIISNTITNNSAFTAFLIQRTEVNDLLQNNNIIGNVGQYAVYLH